MTKPKPAPAKPAAPEAPPTPPPQGSEQQPQESDGNANSSSPEGTGADSGEVPPASGEPMETEKSESARTSA